MPFTYALISSIQEVIQILARGSLASFQEKMAGSSLYAIGFKKKLGAALSLETLGQRTPLYAHLEFLPLALPKIFFLKPSRARQFEIHRLGFREFLRFAHPITRKQALEDI
jgi:hypothetical protein